MRKSVLLRKIASILFAMTFYVSLSLSKTFIAFFMRFRISLPARNDSRFHYLIMGKDYSLYYNCVLSNNILLPLPKLLVIEQY